MRDDIEPLYVTVKASMPFFTILSSDNPNDNITADYIAMKNVYQILQKTSCVSDMQWANI